ncbi:hypothetical protein OFM15_33225, partial [Escherichia coli]|nr:hypothetical protein [Escherichia coli]
AAKPVIEYYTKKFARGVRFAAYGKWNWDTRRATFCLTPNRPDEIEILQATENDTAPETEAETEINSDTVKTVHSGRFVP